MKIGEILVIDGLGECAWNRLGFHCKRYLYPAGLVPSCLFTSILNSDEKVWCRSSRVDTGEERPVFRVEIPGHKKQCYEGPTPFTLLPSVRSMINVRDAAVFFEFVTKDPHTTKQKRHNCLTDGRW
jgi:hypothetical protein